MNINININTVPTTSALIWCGEVCASNTSLASLGHVYGLGKGMPPFDRSTTRPVYGYLYIYVYCARL